MIIFVLPGFASHNPNRKFDFLKENLPECTIVGLTYPNNSPLDIAKAWTDTIEYSMIYYQDKNICFLGSSLGGFWAKYFAEIYNVKSILITPALNPDVTLRRHIGLNHNFYTNAIEKLTISQISEYLMYKVDKFKTNTLVLLDKGDEIIDYDTLLHQLSYWPVVKIIAFEGGNHSFQHMDKSLQYIKEFLI